MGAVIGGSWRREMARESAGRQPEGGGVLVPSRQDCPGCGGHLRLRYENRRHVVTLSGGVRLRLRIRRCERAGCPRFHVPYRPEAESALALPQQEFGLDVIALVGVLRHREHRSVPEIHAALRARGLEIAERSVTNLLNRYDELLATNLTDTRRLRRVVKGERGGILAPGGLQPDVGHEVLWVVRDCLSGEVLLARSLLSATAADLAPLLREVAAAVGVPVLGVVSDGQTSIRRAGAAGGAAPALPVSLPARGGAAGLRGRPACPGAAEGRGGRGAADRAGAGGARRPGGRGGPRLLRRGAQCHHR